MDKLLEKLWNYVAKDQSQTFQARLFRLLTMATCFLCLCVIAPINLIETGLPLEVNLSCIGLGLFALYCHVESGRGRNRIGLFIFVVTAALSVTWFFNAGINGSVTSNFFPVFMMAMVFYRGRQRWVVAALIMLIVVALLVMGYLFPSLVFPFHNRFEQLLDWISGMFVICLAIALVIWVVVTSYDREQQQLARYVKDLAASEENYRGVVENAKCIILRLDAEGKIIFFNAFAENLYGYARAEVIGQPVLGLILPLTSAKGEAMAESICDLLKNPQNHAASENENICRDGRRIRVSWANQPIYGEQGRLQEVLCVGTDVTERVAMLEQLRLTQHTMDAAAEQIVWTNDQGRIFYANAAAIEELGYPSAELHQLALHDFATDFTAAAWADCWQSLKQDRFATLELTQRRKDGSTQPVELSVTYIKVAEKEYATVFIRDLTERKQAEEKRRQHEQQMQHLQRLESLGILAGGIAHDFNNLLTAVLGNISLVKSHMSPANDNFELLVEAEKASGQAKDLTAQLLTFAKGGRPVKRTVNLAQILHDSTGLALRGKAVKCNLHIPPDLQSVEADAAQLSQVFNNLILNAYQAQPEGGIITIQASNEIITPSEKPLAPPGAYVRVTVHNYGQGIAPENLAKIFDPYFTTKKSGTGLGLAVVHSIIKNHAGVISVDSSPVAGTTFSVLLPAARQAETKSSPVKKLTPSVFIRILVMDDEEMLRKVLARMLTRIGCEVETAAEGGAAVQLYQQAAAQNKPFDLVIMDLTIPGGMGGQEAMRQLLEINPDVRAIVSSGYSNSTIMSDHRAFGFKSIVTKPFTIEQIQSAIQTALTA